jgi:hypothetical protein
MLNGKIGHYADFILYAVLLFALPALRCGEVARIS